MALSGSRPESERWRRSKFFNLLSEFFLDLYLSATQPAFMVFIRIRTSKIPRPSTRLPARPVVGLLHCLTALDIGWPSWAPHPDRILCPIVKSSWKELGTYLEPPSFVCSH
ncbi:hypothetical protein OPV22_023168 [Ensete ventricosum]|uniref:Uncharacterized protein n=1 Tax=Ensete ventricosum TaxID=4639 RepID=A0AAV8QLI3_ENSVE|nr:hypothetical protein OPV22_023168 [Ensete ventricosum]